MVLDLPDIDTLSLLLAAALPLFRAWVFLLALLLGGIVVAVAPLGLRR